MQGQRNSVEPFTDVFGFDHGSSSSNSGMDQNAYWNNMLLSPVESQNLQGYLMNRSDAIPTIQYENESRQDGPLFGFWESGEASSSGSSLNYGISSEIKREHLNIGGGLRINERRLEAEHTLSLENVDIDLNTNGNDLCGQSSSGNNAPRGSEQYSGLGGGGTNVEVSGLRLHPHGAVILDTEQMQSFAPLNSYENPLGNFSLMQEDIDPRPGSSLDGRRLACKRKNIEGIHGQCSASASTSFSHRNDNIFPNIASSSSSSAPGSNMPTPPSCFLAPSSTEEQFPCFGATSGLLSSSYDPSGGNNPGSSQRSFRARTSAAQQIAPYGIWPSSSIARHFNSWTHQPALHQSTFDEPSGVVPMASNSTLQYQHPVNVVPGIPQGTHRFVRRGASTSRVGSLSNSASSENRILGTTEEPSGRNVVAANFSDSVPQVDMRHFVPEPSNWNGDGRGTAFAGNIPSASRTNANLLVNPPAGSAWTAHQNMHRRHPRNLAEEIGRLSGALRGHQSPRLRSGFLLERQGDGVWGVPLSSRSREGRRLMEIRNALEMIHRGENVRLESIIYGGVDIHDRHRDMRLDIDNMSYEELLALEERIGNVNTGLSEEIVTKLLKQRKFSSMRAEASLEHEPCCVCQEEYVDGEELGTLDCGHDFHAGCIMQWLLLKNLCPICKNTALKT